jgi:hypothetical protein
MSSAEGNVEGSIVAAPRASFAMRAAATVCARNRSVARNRLVSAGVLIPARKNGNGNTRASGIF